MGNDVLREAALWYKTIEGGKYLITIKKKTVINTLTIYFPTEAFFHLSGLHKLKDIPIVQRSAKKVYKEIIDGKISYQDIFNSRFIDEIKDRLFYFPQIHSILQSDSLYYKSLHGAFKGVKAAFVMTKDIAPDQFGFLFFAEGNPDHYPCSFFNRDEQIEYTKEGTRWSIIDICKVPEK